MHDRGSILRNPSVFIGALVQVRLNRELQIAPVVSIQRNEPKRLLGVRQRVQHFCLPEHRSSVTEEDQTSSGVRIQRMRQTEHAASYGNNLQIACHAAPIRASKNSRGGVWKMYSGSALGREDWGEGCHARQVCYAIKNHRRLRKCLTLRKAMPDSFCLCNHYNFMTVRVTAIHTAPAGALCCVRSALSPGVADHLTNEKVGDPWALTRLA